VFGTTLRLVQDLDHLSPARIVVSSNLSFNASGGAGCLGAGLAELLYGFAEQKEKEKSHWYWSSKYTAYPPSSLFFVNARTDCQ